MEHSKNSDAAIDSAQPQSNSDEGPLEISTLSMALILGGAQELGKDVYTLLKAFAGKKYQEYSAQNIVRGLSTRARDISQVKTLLCLEQPQLISDFYSPQHVTIGSNRLEVTTPDIFGEPRHWIVTGVAGQGKSILFRYLALHELARKKLPLFVELRNFEHANSLKSLLIAELKSLGFPGNEEVLAFLLNSGCCCLFLDAFDEIPLSRQTQARKQIEDILRQHRECRVFVSSRPTLSIEASSFFSVARLDQLQRNEAISALEKMCSDGDNFETISKELSGTGDSFLALLTTPLMVALLLLHFRLSGKFPETEQAFFGDLFDVLFRRHDQTKGYTRTRFSTATEFELSQLFGFLSYTMRKEGVMEMPRTALISKCQTGINFHGRNFEADGALDDIIHGTNLVIEEGGTCRFAHKAIQEFYAARFLVAQPEQDVQTFLRNRSTDWSSWTQVFEFIELLDPFVFYKHFLIPHIGAIAFGDEERRIPNDWIPSRQVYLRLFGHDHISVRDGRSVALTTRFQSVFYGLRTLENIAQLFGAFTAFPWSSVDKSSSSVNVERPDGVTEIPLRVILESDRGHELCQCIENFVVDGFKSLTGCYSFADHREKQSELFE